jgi:hypothetical protein
MARFATNGAAYDRRAVCCILEQFNKKGAPEVRKLVGELTQEEIDKMFPENNKSTVAYEM